MKNNKLNFNGQKIFVGIDVHKKSWVVKILINGIIVKGMRINPDPQLLYDYLTREYPGGEYYSAYEAGFSGFRAHRKLIELGINNIVVNPSEVPTRGKERQRKSDVIDAGKLARELSNGSLEGIYIPSKQQEALRALVRLRKQLSKDQARQKNRIKSLLNFIGKNAAAGEQGDTRSWTKRYIISLRALEIKQPEIKRTLDELLNGLEYTREQIKAVLEDIRNYVYKSDESREIIELLLSVPGVGFITAVVLYTEIMDIRRFKDIDALASYVGLSPAVYSSGEREKTLGISRQRNGHLRNILIESAWTAIRKDKALLVAYGKMSSKLGTKRAIIKISRKLLNRIRHVWMYRERYVLEVVD